MSESENWNRIFISLGRLEEGQKGMNEHIKAVSSKADRINDNLDKHKQDESAHGLGAERRGSGNTREWLGWVVAIVGGIGTLAGAFYKSHG